MADLGILVLPSGPGFSSGPARVFLSEVLSSSGRTLFWDEPSELRGQVLPTDDLGVWKNVIDSISRAADTLPRGFVIVAESFGSILAEALFAKWKGTERESRIKGILHTPPVLDLRSAYSTLLTLGEKEFAAVGDQERLSRMQEIRHEIGINSGLDSPALQRGITLAFEAPGLLPRYFRSTENLVKWASGLGLPGLAPDPEMRDRILRGIQASKAPTTTTFFPDVLTVVCGGAGDPYQSITDFERSVALANAVARKYPVEWVPFPEASHYPHVDAFDRWWLEVWIPFFKRARSLK